VKRNTRGLPGLSAVLVSGLSANVTDFFGIARASGGAAAAMSEGFPKRFLAAGDFSGMAQDLAGGTGVGSPSFTPRPGGRLTALGVPAGESVGVLGASSPGFGVVAAPLTTGKATFIELGSVTACWSRASGGRGPGVASLADSRAWAVARNGRTRCVVSARVVAPSGYLTSSGGRSSLRVRHSSYIESSVSESLWVSEGERGEVARLALFICRMVRHWSDRSFGVRSGVRGPGVEGWLRPRDCGRSLFKGRLE
jgi:hypothetical protein